MSSGFVSEKVLDEKRKQRQEEWDKVRKPDDPETAPEEAIKDTRSLFDQLQANKAKEQEEWDEARKFKNQIRGIDDEEAEFLDEVDDARLRVERLRRLEERQELEVLRRRREEQRLELRVKLDDPVTRSTASKSSKSQSKLLLGAVKRKSSDSLKKADEKKPNLGALAGIGDYSDSSSGEDDS